jgi:hypothetical protein
MFLAAELEQCCAVRSGHLSNTRGNNGHADRHGIQITSIAGNPSYPTESIGQQQPLDNLLSGLADYTICATGSTLIALAQLSEH